MNPLSRPPALALGTATPPPAPPGAGATAAPLAPGEGGEAAGPQALDLAAEGEAPPGLSHLERQYARAALAFHGGIDEAGQAHAGQACHAHWAQLQSARLAWVSAHQQATQAALAPPPPPLVLAMPAGCRLDAPPAAVQSLERGFLRAQVQAAQDAAPHPLLLAQLRQLDQEIRDFARDAQKEAGHA